MTLLIRFRGGCFMSPSHWCTLDLDNKRDYETFENVDWVSAALHLGKGESIEIECLEREDPWEVKK